MQKVEAEDVFFDFSTFAIPVWNNVIARHVLIPALKT